MPTKTITRCPGLFTAPNELGSVPEGALVEAKNVVIRHKDVIEPRRGQTSQSYSFGSASDRAKEIAFYGSTPIIQYGSNKLSRDTGSAWSDYSGTYTPPDATNLRMKFVEMNENLYFTSTKGIYRLDSAAGTPTLAGGPKTADLNGVLATTGSSGFLTDGYRVAYRVTLCIKDANGAIHEGPPSGRAFATASGSSANVSVVFPLPASLSTSYFFRLYRTAKFPSDVDPGDEMNLVYERYLTSAEVSAQSVTFTDATPDEFRGQPLHTNPNTGDGITQANSPPPFAKDIALWDNRLWFGNTKQLHRAFLQLIGVGSGALGGSGLRLGDTLTIDGQDYIAWGSNDAGNGKFAVVSSGSPANNIIDTTRNLVQVINSGPNANIRAYYLSGPDEAPGKFVVESTALDDAQWTVTLNPRDFTVTDLTRSGGTTVTVTTSEDHGLAVGDTVTLAAGTPDPDFAVGTYTVASVPGSTSFTYADAGSNVTLSAPTTYTATRATPAPALAWTPEIPTSGTNLSSDNDEAPHRVYYSKIQQPEAVPLLNYIDVGAKNKAIQRIVPLRDGLFVFKEDGIFIVSGSGAYRVDLLDNTLRLLAWDSATTVSGSIFAYTTQGIVQVNESGVGIISAPVDDRLDIFRYQYVFAGSSIVDVFATGYEDDRQYILWFPATLSAGNISYSELAFVYHTDSGAWTQWEGLPRSCGIVHPDTRKLYLGSSTTNKVAVENKGYRTQDYYDETYTASMTAYSRGTDLTGSFAGSTSANATMTVASASNIDVGDAIVFSDLFGSGEDNVFLVTAKNGTTLTGIQAQNSKDPSGGFPANVTVYKAFECVVRYAVPEAGESVNIREVHPFFGTAAYSLFRHYVQFYSNNARWVDGDSSYEVTRDRDFLWNWANADLVNASMLDFYADRVFAPKGSLRVEYVQPTIRVKEAGGYWRLVGLSLVYENVSERTSR